jgi:hypothetical protein
MNSIINRVLSLLPLDGYKTTLGAILVALSMLAAVLADAALMLPQIDQLEMVVPYVVSVLNYIARYAEAVGVPALYVGLIHKWTKVREERLY